MLKRIISFHLNFVKNITGENVLLHLQWRVCTGAVIKMPWLSCSVQESRIQIAPLMPGSDYTIFLSLCQILVINLCRKQTGRPKRRV